MAPLGSHLLPRHVHDGMVRSSIICAAQNQHGQTYQVRTSSGCHLRRPTADAVFLLLRLPFKQTGTSLERGVLLPSLQELPVLISDRPGSTGGWPLSAAQSPQPFVPGVRYGSRHLSAPTA